MCFLCSNVVSFPCSFFFTPSSHRLSWFYLNNQVYYNFLTRKGRISKSIRVYENLFLNISRRGSWIFLRCSLLLIDCFLGSTTLIHALNVQALWWLWWRCVCWLGGGGVRTSLSLYLFRVMFRLIYSGKGILQGEKKRFYDYNIDWSALQQFFVWKKKRRWENSKPFLLFINRCSF